MGDQSAFAPWWIVAEWIVVLLFAALLLALLIVTVRRYMLERGGGTVECYLRRAAGASKASTGAAQVWRIGCGQYGTDELHWYRIFSLWPRPTATLSRRGLVITGRRTPATAELSELTSDLVVVACAWDGGSGASGESGGSGSDGPEPLRPVVELAMSEAALTGFLSWLEASPPGTRWET